MDIRMAPNSELKRDTAERDIDEIGEFSSRQGHRRSEAFP